MQSPALAAILRRIDLQRFAAWLGYEKDKRESSKRSTIMRSGADKIIIKLNGDGHYLYFSVSDDADNGTSIDFLQRRRRINQYVIVCYFIPLAAISCFALEVQAPRPTGDPELMGPRRASAWATLKQVVPCPPLSALP